ncbi:hypothetical protein MQA17_25320 [Escherichia coli]|nr:hypothetical protein [Escherichia coli]MCI3325432.1 hypothetical protein [Escherichia coli]MCI3341326.1 hypothetical protein [Escherichia coli]MCI3690460.1 hypothetical protein [Escherichia coli]MCI3732260.1 hypothetical protein [Escherichia coli]
MLKFRSVKSIVIAPAKTGKDNRSKIAVIFTDHTNKGKRSNCIPRQRILITVVIKLTAPKIEDTPAKCNEKIAKSTDPPACAKLLAKGGYTVQPVPTPLSTAAEDRRSNKLGGSNQKLILFKRGKAISGAPNIKGINQLPNPPIIIGITRKKIITNA